MLPLKVELAAAAGPVKPGLPTNTRSLVTVGGAKDVEFRETGTSQTSLPVLRSRAPYALFEMLAPEG